MIFAQLVEKPPSTNCFHHSEFIDTSIAAGFSMRRWAISLVSFLLLFITTFSFPATAEVISNNIGYYPMDETSGFTVYDLSGNNNHGIATGTTIVNGISGNARSGSVSGEYISLPSGLLPSTNFTVLMWINIFDNTGGHYLYNHGPQSGCGPSSSWFTAEGDPIKISLGVGCADRIYSQDTLTLNNWYLVGYTTDSDKRDTLYINGVAQNTPIDNTRGYTLGTGNDILGGYWSGGRFYSNMGYIIDDVRLYNRVLTEAEILDIYNNPFSTPSIIQLPQTGQTTCYDTNGAVISCPGTGQDGDIQAGVPWPGPRFTDSGDGTVTDNLTGLM